MDTKLRLAITFLSECTNGSFDIWRLAGPYNVKHRQRLMQILLESPKLVPQSKSGINALRDLLNQLTGITGNCIAEREDNFIQFCKDNIENLNANHLRQN